MKNLVYIILIIVSSAIAQDIAVEVAFDRSGNRKIEKTDAEIRLVWLQMFANGRYKRFQTLANIEQDTVFSNKWKNKIDLTNIDSAQSDFVNSSMFAQIPNDELDNVKFFDRWPWGTVEIKRYIPLRFTDFSMAKLDSVRLDSVSWQIPIAVLRDSLNFNTITLAQVNNNVNVPLKIRQWAQANILNLPGISGQTTLEQLWNDDRVDKRIFRVLFNRLKARWLRRQSQ